METNYKTIELTNLHVLLFLVSKDPDPIISPPSVSGETDITFASVSDAGGSSEVTSSTPSSDSGVGSHASDVVTNEMIEKIRKQSGDAMDIFGQEMVGYQLNTKVESVLLIKEKFTAQ